MPQLLRPLKLGNLGSRLDSWVLEAPVQPPATKRRRGLIVGLLVAFVGLVDCAAGPRISPQVFYLAPIALAGAWLGFSAAFATPPCSIMVRVVGDCLLRADFIQGTKPGQLTRICCRVPWRAPAFQSAPS